VAKGTTATIAFTVPNERDDATTTRVAVQLPVDHPIANVQPKDVAGWTVATDEDPEGRVTTITWSGGTIAGGAHTEFPVELGPLPSDVDVLVFKAVQTYSDGAVVRWIEETPANGDEPEHPAPTLRLSGPLATTATTSTLAVTTTDARDVTGATTATTPAEEGGDDSSAGLVVAIVVAVAVVAGTAVVLARRRRGA
jgi:uncharacterized protein YcnI